MFKLKNKLLGTFIQQKSFSFNKSQLHSIGVIGAPFWNGQSKPGTDHGPDILRGCGLLGKLEIIQNKTVVDFGNLNFGLSNINLNELFETNSFNINNKNDFIMYQMCSKLSHFVSGLTNKGFIPLILGGDHSIAAGSVIGTCNADEHLGQDVSLIWIDAHADANTEHTSPSGNFHGMPISFLVKDIPIPSRTLFNNFKPCLSAKNVVYIGLRDVDKQELRLLKDSNIVYFSMRDVDRLGINEVIARALDVVNPQNRNKLHVSFDVDSVDNLLIPSTGTPVIGGLSVREAICIGEAIANSGQLAALDVVEFNPKIGTQCQVDQSAKYIIDIVLSFFGKSRLGYYHTSEE